MEIWLDTCNEAIIKKAKELNLLHGITTNPILLAKASCPPLKMLQKLLDLQSGPVTVQVTEIEHQTMIKQAHKLHRLSSRFIIKIPSCLEGLLATRFLQEEGICVMATVLYDPIHALTAFKAGATYGAFYIGRMEDNAIHPFPIMDTVKEYLQNYALPHKILGASLRSKEHLLECLKRGYCAATLKEDIFLSLLKEHPLTLNSMEEFSKALPKSWV